MEKDERETCISDVNEPFRQIIKRMEGERNNTRRIFIVTRALPFHYRDHDNYLSFVVPNTSSARSPTGTAEKVCCSRSMEMRRSVDERPFLAR